MRYVGLILALALTGCGMFGGTSIPPDAVTFPKAAFAVSLEKTNVIVERLALAEIRAACKREGGDRDACAYARAALAKWGETYKLAMTELLKPVDPGSQPKPFDLTSIVSALGSLAEIGIKVAPLLLQDTTTPPALRGG